jgi:tetratricopeptide (TPR) repeat protein
VLIRRIAIIIYQYETTHDERLLSSLQADWEDILAHQGFDSLDPPTKSKMFNQAAHSYILSFEQHRTSNHLERAINLWSSALTLLPAGAQWPSLLICLGSGYRDRFGFSDDPIDLELAWQYYVRAHEQNEEFDPWDLCYEVGVSLHQHGASSGAQAELERAVVLLQSLVVHTPQDHQHLHSYLNSYGITLYTRFLLNHSRADLDESVMVLQRSLGCAPADFPQLAKTLHNLGNSLYKRYKVDSNLQDLDDAVEIFTEAIRRDLYSYQLGYDVIQAVLVRYVNRGDPNDLEQIAETIHSVLRWSAEQVEERKSEQNILAEVLALFEREIRSLQRHNHSFEITAWRRLVSEFSLNRYPLLWAWAQLYIGRCLREIDQGDLAQTRDEAIATIQQAVDSFQSQGETELWADSLIDLAIAYMERIAGNTEENIERAIQLCEQALEAINNRDQPQIASRACMELAIGTRMRHRGEVAENIEQAIAYELQAIDIQRHAGIEFYRPLLLRNVAVHYLHRMRGPRAENIEQAIAYLDEALALESSQSSPVKLADILTSIAMAYRQRLYGDRTENIERALAYSRQAVNLLSPADEPVAWADAMSDLAYGYRDRVQGDAAENIEQAINCQRAALGKLSAKHHTSVWAEAMVNLGRLLAQQLRGDEAENIEQAIACHLQVLEVTSPQSYSRERAGALKALGEAYSQRIYGDRNQNIDQAIEYLHQALEAATRDLHPFDWSDTITHLAKVYAERPTGDLSENIDHAIRLLHEALEVVSPETHLRQWASIMLILPKLYHDYPRGSRAENIEQGITYCQQVLERVSRENQPDIWIEATQMLASCYSDIVFRDRRENREKAIQLYHAALELCSPEARPTQWVSVLHNLSATYIVTSNTHPERIDLAIDGFRQVLSVFTRERSPATWAKTLDSLGDAYIARVTGDRAENIEQGIAYYLQALEVRTREAFPTEWALTMKALGIAYSDREQGGRIENAEKSIAFYRNAMEVFTRKRGPFEWADLMHRLGTAISHRLLGNPADNIEEAIRYFLQALEVFNREEFPYDWSAAIYNLGICFLERIQGDPSENNEQAIRYFQQALEVRTREVHPVEWGQTMYELGIAYLQRVQGDRSENLERAIAYFEQGLTVRTVNQAPERWVQTMQRLITAYLQRGLNGDNQRVIELCEATLVIARPQSLPSAAQWLAQLLGYLRFRQSQWPEATEAFQRALQATDVLYRSSLLRESKQLELARVKHLYTYSAYAAARAGALHEATVILEQGRARGLSEALARDQAYLEQLRIAAPDVFADYIDAAGGVQQVEVVERRTFAQTTEVTTPILDASFLDRAHAAHANLERAMARVRQVPGFETFLAGVSWEDIAAAAQSNQPIAYLATTSAGTIVIIVHGDRSEPGVLWVDSFTSDLLDKLIANGRDEQIADGYLYGQLSGLGLADALDKLLPRLGEQLIGPLAEYLRAIGIPGVVLIPCGLLGLLPLHAARYRVANKDLCLLDELDVAYVPSARTLATATISLRQRTAGPTHLSGVANPLPDTVICSQAHTYLVQLSPELPRLAEQVKEQLQLAIDASSDVTPLEAKPALREMTALVDRFVDGLRQIAGASPDSVLHSGHILNGAAVLFALSADPAAMALQEFAGQIPPNLSYARAELESIRDLLPPDATTVLSEANASRDALWAALPAATIVHFACHGQFDAHTPLDSALLLAGGSRLTLRDLLDADRTQTERLRLAVLSACQTAIYDFRYLPDESIGMFAGFLQAGIPAVIGTLWPVDDLSTALLMTRFYELYLRGDMLSQRQATPMSPVTALRMAQLWLRDLTYQQLDKYLQHHRELKHAEETSTSRMSWVLLEQGLRRTRRAMQADAGDKRPFVDPKYWAGFVYYGAL